MAAASSAVGILQRNFLNSFAVWDFVPMVLGFSAVCASATFGIAAGTLTAVAAAAAAGSAAGGVAAAEAAASPLAVGFAAAIIAFVILHFLKGLIIDAVDTVYMAYAADLDTQCVTRADVHGIYSQLPNTTTGTYIAQPDGIYAYGAI